jgi:hypothetical protein
LTLVSKHLHAGVVGGFSIPSLSTPTPPTGCTGEELYLNTGGGKFLITLGDGDHTYKRVEGYGHTSLFPRHSLPGIKRLAGFPGRRDQHSR